MTLHVFACTDTDAPVLTGAAGSLNELLYACLVTGYGAQAGAGWTREFHDDASKTAVFRQPADSKSRCYLQSWDANTGPGDVKVAVWRGFETMTAFDQGAGAFPVLTDTYKAFVWKSSTTTNTPRPWYLVADQRRFYLLINHAGSVPQGGADYVYFYAFGDIAPDVGLETDPGRCVLVAVAHETSIGSYTPLLSALGKVDGSVAGAWLSRSYTGIGTAVQANAHSDQAKTCYSTYPGQNGAPYPYPTDGSLRAYPLWIGERLGANSGLTRGHLPGLWVPGHGVSSLNHLDLIPGQGELAGRTFQLFKYWSANYGLLVETSDTWT